jgi:hypothetical protein
MKSEIAMAHILTVAGPQGGRAALKEDANELKNIFI